MARNRAEIVEALLQLHQEHQHLTPQIVVEEAANESHILHDCFEWDDSKAGHHYRLWQARQLLRITVQEEKESPTSEPKHVFIHTKDPDLGPVYQTRDVLIQKVDLLKAAIEEAQEDLRASEFRLIEVEKLAKEGQKKALANKAKKARTFVHKALEVELS